MDNIIQFFQDNNELIFGYLLKFVAAVFIFYVGRIVAKGIKRLMEKALLSRSVDKAVISFVAGIVYALIMIATVLMALSQIGVQTTSFIAILGAAGLAVGLALQGSLSNFASGILIILFRPFKSGDFIDAGGVSGTVDKIEIFQTIMKTPDNKKVIIPNAQITGSAITNYSAEPTRRVDLLIGISYDSDLRKAKALLEDIVKQDSRILATPAPVIAVAALADSSVNIHLRPWVNAADYWAVYWDTLEKVKLTFDEQGIGIPFPQMDLHIKKDTQE
ncbi:mechanosensitive ion channel family protein [Rheinheimera baltica]|uniref:Small-conductance mechanosensitive channel n=1 Tax=Rheinheimera baltica TaxID=67576 RepID=A0ABT9HVI1_9GAMM|nr:mechanosensitive ion channel domain-containing protein [Rheinheimera baltica]MDP5135131.1 mechanosensitive ion channel [Rheinheimera baltica]MDP5143586.1 mechanosensitive ion channel [Rheinheimera baltica]MDP5151059.1 mechanosensitive ion channel [Rheinheimera baltica]MDP5189767.1 mechanosensitive ion channel [Rheinheimera baltica]